MRTLDSERRKVSLVYSAEKDIKSKRKYEQSDYSSNDDSMSDFDIVYGSFVYCDQQGYQ